MLEDPRPILRPKRDQLREMQLQGFRLLIEHATLPTELQKPGISVSLGASSVYIHVVMPVKYKDIFKIILGIYTRC